MLAYVVSYQISTLFFIRFNKNISIVYWKRHHRTQNDVHTLNLLSTLYYKDDGLLLLLLLTVVRVVVAVAVVVVVVVVVYIFFTIFFFTMCMCLLLDCDCERRARLCESVSHLAYDG